MSLFAEDLSKPSSVIGIHISYARHPWGPQACHAFAKKCRSDMSLHRKWRSRLELGIPTLWWPRRFSGCEIHVPGPSMRGHPLLMTFPACYSCCSWTDPGLVVKDPTHSSEASTSSSSPLPGLCIIWSIRLLLRPPLPLRLRPFWYASVSVTAFSPTKCIPSHAAWHLGQV